MSIGLRPGATIGLRPGTEDVSSTQCATVYRQSKTNAIAEKGLSISSKLLEVGRLAPLAIKAELPGTARKMSLIVMDLIKSTLETIYDRMKSNVDEAFIKAVTDEMKSYVMTSPSGEQASLETNQSTQESNETQIVGRFFAKFITGPFLKNRNPVVGLGAGEGVSSVSHVTPGTHPHRGCIPKQFLFWHRLHPMDGAMRRVLWCTPP